MKRFTNTMVGLVMALGLGGAAITVTACATLPAVGGGVFTKTIIDDKAMYAAEALYNVPAQAFVTATSNHTLAGARATQAQALLVKAYAVLGVARDAYAAGNATNFQAQVKALGGLKDQIMEIVK